MTRCWSIGMAAAFLMLLCSDTFAAEPTTILLKNMSKQSTCAEEDNVKYLFISAGKVKSFKIAASLPVYMPSVVQDYTDPDFTNCPDTPPPPPVHTYTPPPMVLYRDDQIMLRGMVDPRFWRPHKATIRIDKIDWPFLDLVQLWKNTPSGYVEFVVFYPQDGYWRLKTLPPRRFRDVSYGSSFLLGPIQDEKTRPFVDYKRVTFDHTTLTFHIEFEKHGTADVRVTGLADEGRSELTVTFNPSLKAGTAFASLRSMYVAPGNYDTENVVVHSAPGAALVTDPIMAFTSGRVSEAIFSRTDMSKHNVSAPDMCFYEFSK